ncbi:MAG TPA: tetratricopeptide repeat protein [Kofleriaceae bacterium]
MRTALVIALCTARAAAQPADWAPQRDAFDPHVIARYEQMLAADPFDARTLAKLARLFTGRHTTAELERRLRDDRPAGLIARAQLHRTRNDPAGALALYERATELAPAGPFAAKTWLAIAQLHRDRGESAEARAAYRQALALCPPPALAVAALRALADLAANARDPEAETYFVQLLALAPDDPELWLARGSSLAAREPRLASDSFARAEELLVHDPARRLDAIARRGDALDRARDPHAAEAEYWRAIGLAPKGYYLVPELVARIVDVARRAKQLPALRAQLLHDWPERSRGYLEWSTLGQIANELGDRDTAIAELGRAARIAPWELSTQRALIALLVATGRDPRDQLRAAIRAAPSEPTLQLELAQRTWPNQAALALLDRTAEQFSRDASVVLAVAQQLVTWNQPARAERWFEAVARLEPDDDDHWLALAEAHFAADDHRGAVAAWRRVSRPRPGAMLRFASALLDEHDAEQALRWIDASIAIDGLDPEAWRLRAEAGEARNDLERAVEDALREVSLTRPDRGALRRARHHVVRLLEKTRPPPGASADPPDEASYDLWDRYVTRWHDALWAEHPDLDAGYLYVEAIASSHCTSDPVLAPQCPDDLRSSLEHLVGLVPDDPDLLRNAIRVYQEQDMYREAEAGLEKLLRLEPRAAPAIREAIDLVRASMTLRDRGELLYAAHVHLPDGIIAAFADKPSPDAPASLRAGIAIDYGATLHGSLGGSIGLGAFAQSPFGVTGAKSFSFAELRADWNQSTASDAAALSAGIGRQFAAFSVASLSLCVDERAELRFGDPMAGAALATDASAALGLYDAPLDLAVRIEQWYAGSSATRALLEVRVRLF